jgi:hypothetical protein
MQKRLFLFSETVRAAPDEIQIYTTGNSSMGFSLPVLVFVPGELSIVFHKSDFETKFGKTGLRFILTRFIMVHPGWGR